MKLVDHSVMDSAQLEQARKYANLLPEIGAEFNEILKKHGLQDLCVDSFTLRKFESIDDSKNPPYPTGVGVTTEGLWHAKSYHQ
jgi:hypothetical protein